jgi:hypothetical protein
MPVKFQSRYSPDILMFDDVAARLLKAMGHSGTVPGSIPAEEVPAALARLRQAIATDERVHGRDEGNAAGDDEENGPRVSFTHRALPLIEMLETAAANGTYVIWKK